MNILKIYLLIITFAFQFSATARDCNVFLGGLESVYMGTENNPLYAEQILSMESFLIKKGYQTVPTKEDASIIIKKPYAVCVSKKPNYCKSSHSILTIYDKVTMPYTYTFGGRFKYKSAKKALAKADKHLKNYFSEHIGTCSKAQTDF